MLLLLATAIAQLSLTTGHDWGDDFAGYILQADSLLEGRMWEESEENRFTIERSGKAIGPVAYPWGTPALLAPVLATSGLDFLALKHVNLLCFALLLAVVWYGLGDAHARPYRLLLVALIGLNPFLVGALDTVQSDVPFLLVSTLAVVMIGHRVRDGCRGARDGVLLGAVLALACALRSNGILLVATLVAADLVRLFIARRDGLHSSCDATLRSLIPYLVFGAITGCLSVLLPRSNASMLSQLFHYRIGAAAFLRYYATLPAEFFGMPALKSFLFGLSLPFAFVGLVRRARAEAHVALYCGLTIALLIAWPYAVDRYLLPLLPFYFSFFVSGLESFERSSASWLRRGAVVVVVGLSLAYVLGFARMSVGAAVANLRAGRVESAPGPTGPTARELYAFVRSQVPRDRIVLAHKPRAMRLFGEHRTYRTGTPSELPVGGYYCHYRPGGDIVQLSEPDLAALVRSGRLELVFQNAEFALYRIEPLPGSI